MSYGNGGDLNRNNPSPASGSGNAYGSGPMQPPAKKSNTVWWILGILGFLTIGGALVCCGGGYYALQFGTQVVADEVKKSIASDAAIQEHIGTISEMNMNLTATGAAGGNNKLVFDVKGDKGAGQLEVIVNNTAEGQAVNDCVLILPDGTRLDVVIAGASDEASGDDTIDTIETEMQEPSAPAAAEIEVQETAPATN